MLTPEEKEKLAIALFPFVEKKVSSSVLGEVRERVIFSNSIFILTLLRSKLGRELNVRHNL